MFYQKIKYLCSIVFTDVKIDLKTKVPFGLRN
jgi:hypothetical protein